MNAAATAVSGDFATLAPALSSPGLVSAYAASYAAAGLSVSATLPAPFGIFFSNGVFSQAHGTTTNADTQVYAVSFSGVVPASGSITAYLLASYATIQQQPKQIIGPQPGHPDYNPQFTPLTAYQVNVDSLSLTASSGAANNTTTFELFRVTLAAGATGVGAINTTYQIAAAPFVDGASVYVSGGTYNVAASQGNTNFFAYGTTTFQLPLVSGLSGTKYNFYSRASGTVTVQVSGATDFIYGTLANPSSGLTLTTISSGLSLRLIGGIGAWNTQGMSVGTLSGVLSGHLPSPGMAAGAAATNVGTLGGALSGVLPNPTMASGGSLPGNWTAITQASGDNSTNLATTAYADRAATNAVSGFPALQALAPIAWVMWHYTASTVTIFDSINVTSLTRNSAGNYTVATSGITVSNAFAAPSIVNGGPRGYTAGGSYGTGANPSFALQFLDGGGGGGIDPVSGICVITGR